MCSPKTYQKMKLGNLINCFKQLGGARTFASKNKNISPEEREAALPTFEFPKSRVGDRRVYLWGLAESGALGMAKPGEKKNRSQKAATHVRYPRRCTFGERFDVTQVAAGYGFTVFSIKTKEKYKIWGTGLNTDSQIGYHSPRSGHPLELLQSPAPIYLPYSSPDTNIIGLDAGRAHTVIVTDKDGVFTLGNNSYGQCGRKIIENEEYRGSMAIHRIKKVDGEIVKKVCCGQDHTLLLSESGKVFACGWGADGQTGLGHFRHQERPARVQGDIASETIVKLASTGDCVLALNDKGEVFGWGNSEYGQIPLDAGGAQQVNRPVSLRTFTKGLGAIVDVAAGGSFCLITNDQGDVFVWGFGLLGLGPRVEHKARPTQIPSPLFGRNEFNPNSKVVKVSCGIAHMAAITNHGDLYMWGRNRHGCLGLGSEEDQTFPLKVAVGAHVLDVRCGVDHSIAFCKPFV